MATRSPDAGIELLGWVDGLSINAAGDVDLSTRIDAANFNFVFVVASKDAGNTAVTLKAQSSATSGGALTDISDPPDPTDVSLPAKTTTLVLSGTEDNVAKVMQVRMHGAERFLSLNATGSGTGPSVVNIFIFGCTPRDSKQMAHNLSSATQDWGKNLIAAGDGGIAATTMT